MKNLYAKKSKKKEYITALFISAICLSAIVMGTAALKHRNDSDSGENIVNLNEETINEMKGNKEINENTTQTNEESTDVGQDIEIINDVVSESTSPAVNIAPDREVAEVENGETKDESILKQNKEISQMINEEAGQIINEENGKTEDKLVEEATIPSGEQNGSQMIRDEEESQIKDMEETNVNTQALTFDENTRLAWPVQGNIILDYNMDNTIYFSTLDVYKCNPAVVIQSDIDTAVVAAADGCVEKVSVNDEVGNYVVINMGTGYRAMYGQLNNISVKEGDYVAKGQQFATIAEPSKFYSKEGYNLYFKLTKDDEPVNPEEKFE